MILHKQTNKQTQTSNIKHQTSNSKDQHSTLREIWLIDFFHIKKTKQNNFFLWTHEKTKQKSILQQNKQFPVMTIRICKKEMDIFFSKETVKQKNFRIKPAKQTKLFYTHSKWRRWFFFSGLVCCFHIVIIFTMISSSSLSNDDNDDDENKLIN